MLNSEYVEMRKAINRAFPLDVMAGKIRIYQQEQRDALYVTLNRLRQKEMLEQLSTIRGAVKIATSSTYGLTDQQRLDKIREHTKRRLNGKYGQERS
jgi:hypothetical protein